jgi:hypothetical protein
MTSFRSRISAAALATAAATGALVVPILEPTHQKLGDTLAHSRASDACRRERSTAERASSRSGTPTSARR